MISAAGILIILLGAAGMILAALLYLRAEIHVRGRRALLGLRLGALAVVLLLLLDVRLPGEDPSREPRTGVKWVLVDPDLSLVVPSGTNGSLWDAGIDRVETEVATGAQVAFATPGTSGPEGADLSGLVLRTPSHPPGDLAEGIARLAEAGADSIVVLSSFRRPPGFLEVLERRTPVAVRLDRLGGEPVRNAGMAELVLPAARSAGQPVTGRVSVFGEGGAAGDTVAVEIRSGGTLVDAVRLPLPGPGALASAEVRLPPTPDTGLFRVTARALLEGDAFPPDDELARWIRAGELESGIVLVSFEPGWGPRYLLPVLEAVTGLPGEGYLALGDGRFLPLGDGEENLAIVGLEFFLDRMNRAALLVLHGTGESIPPWASSAAAAHPAVLHFPVGAGGAAVAGIEQGSTVAEERVVDPQLPASAVSPFLSGVGLGGLPAVTARLSIGEPSSTQVAVRGRPAAGGNEAPLLFLDETEAGRRAVSLADGFWRWGSRDGEARDAYRALWGGVASWLLDRAAPLVEEGVRPAAQVQPRGVPVRWEVSPGLEGAELSLFPVQVQDGPLPTDGEGVSGAAEFRGLMTPGEDGIASTPVMDPGVYRFEVRDPGTGLNGPLLTAGLVEVEAWAPSLRHPPLDVPERLDPAPLEDAGVAESAGRPLRTHPLPYFVLLGFLCGEWLGRRRVGLR